MIVAYFTGVAMVVYLSPTRRITDYVFDGVCMSVCYQASDKKSDKCCVGNSPTLLKKLLITMKFYAGVWGGKNDE